MVEQQYISPALPHSDALSEAPNLTESARSSSTSSYYSAVSSFNLPTQCDTNLLTPVSVAGSPPLQQIRKLMGQYPPPPGSPQTQEPTPPGSSKMYHQWNNPQFDMEGQPSTTSSPMGTPAHVAPNFYLSHDDRRTPGPPEPYMGMFGVSDPADPGHMTNSGPPYYIDVAQMHGQNGMMVRDGSSMSVDHHRRDLGRTLPSSGPLLNNPQSHLRHTRRPSTDNSTLRSRVDTPRSPSGSPRRRPVAGHGRVKKRLTKRQSASLRNHQQPDPSEEHKNCHGQEVAPLLKSTCPDEERCIFDSRWEHRHQRGQDMWDSIQSDFLKRFNKSHGKEMLQMKFKRARSKYIEWLPKDEDILRQAWIRMERERYQTLLDIFVEMGGSRNMRVNASDIEVKVVNDLKLEEHLYVESYRDLELRRRRKVAPKKRCAGTPDGMQAGDDLMAVEPRTAHNEDDVVNQVHGRRDMRWETDSSTHSEMMDAPAWDNRAPMVKIEPGESLRMMNGIHTRGVYGTPK